MDTSTKLLQFQITIFNYVIFISYALYFIAIFGIYSNAPEYLADLQYYVKIYVSLFLIWRFNWFRTVQFTELDKKIAFTAGLFLLTTTFIDEFIKTSLQNVKQNVVKYYT